MAPTDYSKRKNAELEELLKARGLPHTGKKAELVARLQASDSETGDNQADGKPAPAPAAEDEIDWDDDAATAAATTAPAAAAMAAGGQVQPPNPVAVPNQVPAQDPAVASDLTVKVHSESQAADAVTDLASTSAPAAEAPPAQDFASHIPSTTLTAELEKRKARAARFGLPTTTTEESDKALERAKRFGLEKAAGEDSETTNTAVAGLDRALPERERKRGRGGRGLEEGQDGGGKRKDSRRRDGKGATGGRGDGGRRNGAGTGARVKKTGGAGEMSEKDRMAVEARKKRFAAAAAV